MGTKSDKWQVFPVRLSGKTIEALRREAERRETTPSALLRALFALAPLSRRRVIWFRHGLKVRLNPYERGRHNHGNECCTRGGARRRGFSDWAGLRSPRCAGIRRRPAMCGPKLRGPYQEREKHRFGPVRQSQTLPTKRVVAGRGKAPLDAEAWGMLLLAHSARIFFRHSRGFGPRIRYAALRKP
jgi:hypothetical protein